MATITAIGSGEWDNPAIWDLGRIPANGDDVAIADQTVNIGSALTIPATGKLGAVTNTTGNIQTTTFSGAVSFNAVSMTSGANAILHMTWGQHFGLHVDDVYASLTSNGVKGIEYNGDADTALVIVGNVHGGSTTNAWGVDTYAGGNLAIYGNVTGGSGTSAYGLVVQNSPHSVLIVGNVTGGSVAHGVNVGGVNVTMSIMGNITGGSSEVNAVYGVYANSTTLNLTCVGDIIGGASRNSTGLYNNSTGTITLWCNIINTLAAGIVGNVTLETFPWSYVQYNSLKFYTSREQIGGAITSGTQGWSW